MRRSAVDWWDLKPCWSLQVFQRLYEPEKEEQQGDETFKQSGKQDSFKHILTSSSRTHESSGL